MINVAEVDGRIVALVHQRNMALDQAALLSGMLAVKDEQITHLQEQLQRKDSAEEPADRTLPFSQEQLVEMARQAQKG